MSDDVNGANILARKQAEVDTLRAKVEELEAALRLHAKIVGVGAQIAGLVGCGADDTPESVLAKVTALKAERFTVEEIADYLEGCKLMSFSPSGLIADREEDQIRNQALNIALDLLDDKEDGLAAWRERREPNIGVTGDAGGGVQ